MSNATRGWAFKCDGQLWVVTDSDVAAKWQKQGFEVTPVTPMTDITPEEYADYFHGARSAGLEPYSYEQYCVLARGKKP